MTKNIPWWMPQFGKKELELIKKTLTNNFPNEGKQTEEFEKKIAELLNVKYAIAVTSGTIAIYVALKALGIGKNDEVIVPDMTFIATANAVEMTGAKAILADIDLDTLMLDPKNFDKKITKKTKAVIPVHVSGRSADIEQICAIAKKNTIAVVEDAAEALMSKKAGRYLGTFGQLGCFSFSPAKIITTGQGGMIVTNNKQYYEIIKKVKDHGRLIRGTGGDDIHEGLGFNFKFTDLQAAVGNGQLLYLKKRMKRLKKNYLLYKKYLNDIDQVRLFECNIEAGELPLWTDIIAEKRDKLEEFLRINGADCRKIWHPIHTQTFYKTQDKFFPSSSNISPKGLWLPSAFTLKDTDIFHVCNLIKTFYAENNS